MGSASPRYTTCATGSGPTLAAKGKDSLPRRLFASFINPFSVVLLLLACISFFTDYLLAADEKDLTAVIIVAVMVCISGVLHFVQEARSGNAVARLESLVKPTIEVVREGEGKGTAHHPLVLHGAPGSLAT